MKLAAIALLLLLVAPVATAQDDDGLDELDKEVLVEIVRRQSRAIERLEARIAELEAEMQGGGEDVDDEPVGREFESVGDIFREFPGDLLPPEGNSWHTYLDDANEWLGRRTSGATLATRSRRGEGWRVTGFEFIEDGKWEFSLYPPYVDSVPHIIRGVVHGGGSVRGEIPLSRGVRVTLRPITFLVTNVELFRTLESAMRQDKVVSIAGQIEDMQIHPAVRLRIADNPRVQILERHDLAPLPEGPPTIP
jgi:hypothetical protein